MSRVTWALSCHLPCTWNRRWRKQFGQYSNFAHFEIMNYSFILQFITQTFIRCLQYVMFKISPNVGTWKRFHLGGSVGMQLGGRRTQQPRIRIGVLGFIFYNGRPKNSNMGVQVYWVPSVLGFIFNNGQPWNPTWEARCTGFYFLYRTTKIRESRCTGFNFLLRITEKSNMGVHYIFYNGQPRRNPTWVSRL